MHWKVLAAVILELGRDCKNFTTTNRFNISAHQFTMLVSSNWQPYIWLFTRKTFDSKESHFCSNADIGVIPLHIKFISVTVTCSKWAHPVRGLTRWRHWLASGRCELMACWSTSDRWWTGSLLRTSARENISAGSPVPHVSKLVFQGCKSSCWSSFMFYVRSWSPLFKQILSIHNEIYVCSVAWKL